MIFGGGAVTPAVKFLLIVNVGVFVVQTVIGSSLEQQLTFYFGLVPPLVLQNLYLWQLFFF
jgi:membrane associated rhomboid family serine protease